MWSVPPNKGWIDQSYSKLEITCPKKNQLSIESMENLCFMTVLNLPVKDVLPYKDEILKIL